MNLIKKIIYFFVRILASSILLLLITYASLYTPFVQAKITGIITRHIAEKNNIQIQISRVSWGLWKDVNIHDLSIKNADDEIIVTAKKIGISIQKIIRKEKQVYISNIALHHISGELIKNEHGVWNFQSLLSGKQTNLNWDIHIHSITLISSNLIYKNLEKHRPLDYGINFSDLYLSDIQLHISDFSLSDSLASVNIQSFSGKEKSGFIVQKLLGIFSISKEGLDCSQVQIFTKKSHIHAEKLSFSYSHISDFSNFISAVSINSEFQWSELHLLDISYFAPKLELSPYSFVFAGNIFGRVSNIRGRNMHIAYGEKSHFRGNVEIMGLPDIRSSFIHIQTQEFTSNVSDIENIRIPPYTESNFIQVPDFLHEIETFSYEGNITGFINDIVAYGTFTTSAGIINADVSIKKSPYREREVLFSGDLQCKNFNIQKVLSDNTQWGKTSLSLKVKGDFYEGKFNKAFIRGDISKIEFLNYTYHTVSVDGLISKQRFDGQLDIADSNLIVNFSGLFDFHLDIPEFNFYSRLSHANLYALGFVEDTLSILSMETQVDFIGLQLDNLKGTVSVPYARYISSFGDYDSEHFTIEIDNVGDYRNILLSSDLLDITVNGKGLYQELPGYIYTYLKTHISDLPEKNFDLKHETKPHFTVSAHIKKADSLIHVFYPNIHIAQGTFINSVFDESQQILAFESQIPDVQVGNIYLENIHLTITGNNTGISNTIQYDLPLKERTITEIISSLYISQNRFEHSSKWDHTDSIQFKGDISNIGIFSKSNHAFLPKISTSLVHEKIIIADSVWYCNIPYIGIDSSSISITQAELKKSNESIRVFGTISHNPHDTITASFNNYDISNLNYLIPAHNIRFDGILEGKIHIQNVYDNPLVFANIHSNDFYFNGHPQGTLRLQSSWLRDIQAVAIELACRKGETDIFSLQGTYIPEDHEIDFSIGMRNYLLSDFSEIFRSILSNISGNIDAKITAKGKLDNPKFEGEIDIKRGRFTVDYTQISYNMIGKMKGVGSRFEFSDIHLSDMSGNQGNVAGFVDLRTINNPQYRFGITTQKLSVLNTQEQHNPFFYGRAFFQGNITISGDLKKSRIAATGRTLEQSMFNIPLAYSELSEQRDFLFFGNQQTQTTTDQKIEQRTSYPELQLNLEITPQTLGQIIFDKQVGDIIRVRGNANLHILMNNQGDLSMFGEYAITEGDYLFTLKSLINKRFVIQRGGTIQWSGNPLQANINITADYRLKASPQPIMRHSERSGLNRRIDVVCRIFLRDDLLQPSISYDIVLPDKNEEVQIVIDNFSEEEKNFQFLSLLLANTFYSSNPENQSGAGSGLNTASFEVLTAQMNQFLSQIDDGLDIGLNYRPGTDLAGNELELALSTQILNNRVLINLNSYTEFGQSGEPQQEQSQTSDFTGDISVEVKLSEDGNFRVRGFSRTNTDPLDQRQGNIQGVGFFYSRDFNYIRDIFKKKGK